MAFDMNVYGYVDGRPVYSRDEFVCAARGFGPITKDSELFSFAEKVTGFWSHAGWRQNFEDYYLSDYAMAEPYRSLTKTEFERLRYLQAIKKENVKRCEESRLWKLVDTICYADNSTEEIYEDKDGNRKTVLAVGPHGDAC